MCIFSVRRRVSSLERPACWSPQTPCIPRHSLSNRCLKNPDQSSSHTPYIDSECAGVGGGEEYTKQGWGEVLGHTAWRGVPGCHTAPPSPPHPPRHSLWLTSPTAELRGIQSKDRTARKWTQNTEQTGRWPSARAGPASQPRRAWAVRGRGRGVAQCRERLTAAPQDCGAEAQEWGEGWRAARGTVHESRVLAASGACGRGRRRRASGKRPDERPAKSLLSAASSARISTSKPLCAAAGPTSVLHPSGLRVGWRPSGLSWRRLLPGSSAKSLRSQTELRPVPQPRPRMLRRASASAALVHLHPPASARDAQTCVCIRRCRGLLGSEFCEEDWEWWEEEAEALLALSNCT